MSIDPIDDPELLNIISSALEMRDEGIEPPIEQLCGGRPDLVEAVREAIDLVGDLPSIQERVSGRDPHAQKVLRERYRLESRIGSGAMGVVYRAHDLELQRSVAVKILRTDALTAQEAEQRFVREAELLAAIRHPAVITIHDRGTTELDEAFLVTELLEGGSLADLLDEGRRRESAQEIEGTAWIAEEIGCEPFAESSYLRTVVRWAAELAAGLNAAHEAGVIHRDVKPSNVFIDGKGKPVLLDFGIAASSAHATLMRDSGALGTPAYMAPESLNENVEARPTLDVYSLTATLYHMLVCRAPYQGSPSQVISSLSVTEPPPAYKLRPGLPRDLQAILDKGMARRVSERYGSALELESDLRAFLNYRPVSARPISTVGRIWRKLRRSTAFYAAAGVALVAISLAVGANLKAKREIQNQAAYLDVWEHVPPGLTLGAEAFRRVADHNGRTAIQQRLDDSLRWRPKSVPARLIRASFRLDHGDPGGASEDMIEIAYVMDTPFSAALAESYRVLPEGSNSARLLDLMDLPEPNSSLDLYLAGFHQLRAENYGKALKYLEAPVLEDHAPTLGLLVPLYGALIKKKSVGQDVPSKELMSQKLENYARAERLEEQVGRRTASTALNIGVTLIGLEKYREALEPLSEGLQLCPESYGLNLNLGIAARRLLLSEEARVSLGKANSLRPEKLGGFTTLARVHIADEELDLAREVVASAPFGSSISSQMEKLELEGDIEFADALRLYRDSSVEDSHLAAERALEKYTAIDALKEEGEGKGARPDRALTERKICQCLIAGEEESVFGHVLDLMSNDPLRWKGLGTVIGWMPDDLDSEQTLKVRAYFKRLKQALSQRGK